MKKVVLGCLILLLIFFQLGSYAQDDSRAKDFEAKVIGIKGKVKYKAGVDWWKFWVSWSSLKPGDKLKSGDILKTEKNSRVDMEFINGTRVLVREQSELKIASKQTGKVSSPYLKRQSLKLKLGQVWVKTIDSLSELIKFKVRTPNAVAGVRGTLFTVKVDSKQMTKVSVKEGRVAVSNYEQEKIVGENRQLEIDPWKKMGQIKEIKANSKGGQGVQEWVKETKQWAEDKKSEIDEEGLKQQNQRRKSNQKRNNTNKKSDDDNDKRDSDSQRGDDDSSQRKEKDQEKNTKNSRKHKTSPDDETNHHNGNINDKKH